MAPSIADSILKADLKPPRTNQPVYKDDCSYCFDTPDSVHGLDICLSCFHSSSPDPSHNYTAVHEQLTGHKIYVNIKRKPKPRRNREESPPKIAKLAIEAEREEDRYESTITVKHLDFEGIEVDKSIGNLQQVIDGILSAVSYSQKQEIQAWEQEIVPCGHITNLQQLEAHHLESQCLAHCGDCDLKENLWLCLTCGNLGCGRAQFGGVGGNSHGLNHFQETKHVASVKLGSITPEGSADVYCYICAEEVLDPKLVDHLLHWGINITEREKTEKSLTEMQLEQNLKWDFSMTTDDGKTLEPIFGPGLTGIKNLGNSCYVSSVLQCLFSIPSFRQRYYEVNEDVVSALIHSSREPAVDLEIQMRKLADGLLSGRYSTQADDTDSENPHQKGIAPGMFKALIGKDHEEFSTMRQQDAFEFFIHLLDKLSNGSKNNKLFDPLSMFQFTTEQRLECLNCHKVRYREEDQENLSIPVPVRKKEATEDGKDGYETILLKECFDAFMGTDTVDYKCKPCGHTGSSTTVKFKTFPEVLVLNARRFQIINWVPTKLDIPVEVNDELYNFDEYLSAGPRPDVEDIADPKEEEDEDESKDIFIPNEGALSILEGMGFPRVRCEKALHATGNSDSEAAMNWLFAHMEDPDIDVPLELGGGGVDEGSVSMLVDMGFSAPAAKHALKKNGGNVEASVEWLFNNPDEGNEELEDKDNKSIVKGDASLPANYRIKAIICHKGGSIHAGHYVAFVRRPENNEWVLFNDEKVVKGGEVEELKKFAYVYLFERLNTN